MTAAECPLNVDYEVLSVAYSPDGSKLAAAHYKTVSIFNMETNEVLCTVNVGSLVWSVSFSPAGDIVAAGCGDGTVQLIDVATAEVKRPLNVGYAPFSLDVGASFNQISQI